jgi:trimethylamine:corrinoid methyltransferase-like protein
MQEVLPVEVLSSLSDAAMTTEPCVDLTRSETSEDMTEAISAVKEDQQVRIQCPICVTDAIEINSRVEKSRCGIDMLRSNHPCCLSQEVLAGGEAPVATSSAEATIDLTGGAEALAGGAVAVEEDHQVREIVDSR